MWVKLLGRHTLNAAFTVEASLIMGICLLVVSACIMLAFTIYHESMDYVSSTVVSDFDVVSRFRQVQLGTDVVESIRGR